MVQRIVKLHSVLQIVETVSVDRVLGSGDVSMSSVGRNVSHSCAFCTHSACQPNPLGVFHSNREVPVETSFQEYHHSAKKRVCFKLLKYGSQQLMP